MLNIYKRIYSYLLNLSNKKYGTSSLFFVAFIEASIFPIPPDILLIPLALGVRKKVFYLCSICTFGSVLGGITGYYIGQLLWWDGINYSNFANFFFNNIPNFSIELFNKIKTQYDIHGFLIIFSAGFTPIPYKIFTISAGAFNISLSLFIFASLISRSTRFFLIGILIYKYGKSIRTFINNYFNILSIIVTIIIILFFILFKVLHT